MSQAEVAARRALESTVAACTHSGLTAVWRTLVQDVYAGNLDRHEPEELGDTPMSFGTQCYENLKTRAIRRFRHDDLEPADVRWEIVGLRVSTPRNVLTFSLGNAHVVTMKVQFAERRSPNWDRSSDWDQYSQIRLAIATENSMALRYRSHPVGAPPLFPYPGSPLTVRNYMLLWAGEADAALTAGWLGVPILGDTPFIARERLWWDDEPRAGVTEKGAPDRGPSFDERPAAKPAVSLKKQYKEGQA